MNGNSGDIVYTCTTASFVNALLQNAGKSIDDIRKAEREAEAKAEADTKLEASKKAVLAKMQKIAGSEPVEVSTDQLTGTIPHPSFEKHLQTAE